MVNCNHSLQITAAVHRYYESRTRIFNDEQPARAVAVQKSKESTRRRQLQKKVFLIFVFFIVKLCL